MGHSSRIECVVRTVVLASGQRCPLVRSSSKRKLVTGADRSATNCPITSRRVLPWCFRGDERLSGKFCSVIEIVARPRRFELLTFAFGAHFFDFACSATRPIGAFGFEGRAQREICSVRGLRAMTQFAHQRLARST
jgi:hypothetical protein